jgi:hypothetical protein
MGVLGELLGARWEATIGSSKQRKEEKETPPAPYSAITGYGTVNRTPMFCAQITSPINRTRNMRMTVTTIHPVLCRSNPFQILFRKCPLVILSN